MAIFQPSKTGGSARQPSVSPLERLPKVLSESREQERAPESVGEPAAKSEAEAPPGAPADTSAQGKQSREAARGTVSLYDQEGERLSTVRSGRMPEKKQGALCGALAAECQHIVAQRPDLTVVKLADGAEEHWPFLGTSCSGS